MLKTTYLSLTFETDIVFPTSSSSGWAAFTSVTHLQSLIASNFQTFDIQFAPVIITSVSKP